MLVLISDSFDSALPGRLTELDGVEVTEDTGRLAEADVVLIRSKTKCTKEYLDQAPRLKLIIRGGVGLDNVDLEYASKRGIRVDNTPQASSIAVAELAFGLMLAAVSRVAEGHLSMSEGRWAKKELKRTELYQKTLGLIGVGRIATEVAKRAAAFGMKPIGVDPYVTRSDSVELRSFEDVIKQADILSLHTPLVEETRHLLNSDVLAQTQQGVVVVNTARADCVDPVAMKKALDSGHVRCYATDVWPTDPPPENYTLLKGPNVLMTPHIGASSKENLARIGDIVVDKIRSFKG